MDGLREAGHELAGVVPCQWAVHEAYDAVGAWLSGGTRRGRLICLNDRIAMGAYQALAEHGLRVPDDVSVVSFDGSELAGWLRPEVTSVALPHAGLGALAVDTVLGTEPATGVIRVPMTVSRGGSVRGRDGARRDAGRARAMLTWTTTGSGTSGSSTTQPRRDRVTTSSSSRPALARGPGSGTERLRRPRHLTDLGGRGGGRPGATAAPGLRRPGHLDRLRGPRRRRGLADVQHRPVACRGRPGPGIGRDVGRPADLAATTPVLVADGRYTTQDQAGARALARPVGGPRRRRVVAPLRQRRTSPAAPARWSPTPSRPTSRRGRSGPR